MANLEIKGISKSFGTSRVLENISFSVEEGGFLSLLGPSGCGKTTLLRIIAGLECPDGGEIVVGEDDITDMLPEKRNIGVVFQNYALIPHMTVFNNIAFGLKIRHVPKQEIIKCVQEYVDLVGLNGMETRKVTQLSGGQQQRVALARALIIQPNILLLDEPLSALDRKIRAEMQYEIRRIQQAVGITTVFVTHDQEEAMTMSDQILLMNKGHIEQLSSPKNIYINPVSLYASDFLGKANVLPCVLEQNEAEWIIRGDGWRLPVEFCEGFADGQRVTASIRGEHISLSAEDNGGCPIEITNIIFTGELCRINANMGTEKIVISCINTVAGGFHVGQRAFASVQPSLIHYYA